MKKYFFILFAMLGYLGQIGSAVAVEDHGRTLFVSSVEYSSGSTPSNQIYNGTWSAYNTLSAERLVPPLSSASGAPAGSYLCLAYGSYNISGGLSFSAQDSQCVRVSSDKTWGTASSLWISSVAGGSEAALSGSFFNVQHSGLKKSNECLAFAFLPNALSETTVYEMMSGCIKTPPPSEIPCTLDIDDIVFDVMTTGLPGGAPEPKFVNLTLSCDSPIPAETATIQLQSMNMTNGANYLDEAKQIKYDFFYGTQSLDKFVEVPVDTSSSGGIYLVNDAVTIELEIDSSDISPGVYTTTDTIVYYVL